MFGATVTNSMLFCLFKEYTDSGRHASSNVSFINVK